MAEFLLEDIREILRKSIPGNISEEDTKRINELKKRIIEILEGGEEDYSKINESIEIRTKEEDFINIHPIQAAGRLTPEARKALISYGDGYSTCDYCRKPFRLDKIRRPPIEEFHHELAEFLGMDVARVVPGARRGFQVVTSSLVKKGDFVLVSSLAHYTEFLAVEQAGGIVKEIPANEKNIITGDATAERIEELKKEGRIALLMIEHFDYVFGNEHEVGEITKIAHEYEIPVLYNGAYSVGVMPVNGRELGVDFVVGSGHKSMASPAPSGVLATTEEWAQKIFRTTEMRGDITGRRFGIKEVELLGCTLMGATLIGMMASFPRVKERVKNWEDEVKKSNYFIKEFLRIRGNKVMSELPRKHTLTKVDTTDSFDVIARNHKRRGFFLSDELKRRGITGEFAGATKTWKLNTYGLTWEQIKYLSESFIEIAEKYGIEVESV